MGAGILNPNFALRKQNKVRSASVVRTKLVPTTGLEIEERGEKKPVGGTIGKEGEAKQSQGCECGENRTRSHHRIRDRKKGREETCGRDDRKGRGSEEKEGWAVLTA